jgi:hypothetical protein
MTLCLPPPPLQPILTPHKIPTCFSKCTHTTNTASFTQDLSGSKALNVYSFDCSRKFPKPLISTLTTWYNHQAIRPAYLLPYSPVFLRLLRSNTAHSLARSPNYLSSRHWPNNSVCLTTHLCNKINFDTP